MDETKMKHIAEMDSTDFCAFIYTSTNKGLHEIIEGMKKRGETDKVELAQMAITRRALNKLALYSKKTEMKIIPPLPPQWDDQIPPCMRLWIGTPFCTINRHWDRMPYREELYQWHANRPNTAEYLFTKSARSLHSKIEKEIEKEFNYNLKKILKKMEKKDD